MVDTKGLIMIRKKLSNLNLSNILMLLIAVVIGIIIGCSATLLSISKEMGFWEIDKVQNEIRLEVDKIDEKRIDIEELLVALEKYGIEINGVLIRKDGQDYLKFKLGEVK